MQRLNGSPREHLTDAQVTALLQASNVEVDFGADLLDTNLAYLSDISEDLAGGSVDWALHNRIHRTCRLQMSRSLRWGVDLVRPWMTLSDGAVTAKFYTGVFSLTTPDRVIGETPELYEVDGFDRLYLLDRQVGADYTVASGTTYRQALLDVFAAAGLSGAVIDGSAADDTLPADKTWPLVAEDTGDPDQTDTPVTFLRLANDLCRAISFRSVWCDEQGRFRCQSYQSPTVRATEFVLDADDINLTVLGEDRQLAEDVWKVPNRWTFRRTNGGTGVEGDGVYTVDLSDTTNGDWLGRKLVWTSVVDYEAASQAKLVDLGDRRVEQDRNVSRMIEVGTGPLPIAGHADVLAYRDAAVGNHKVQARSWTLPLDGSDMRWTLEVVS
jgi:hypothetical protein